VEFTSHAAEKGFLVKGKLYQSGVPRAFIASVPLYASGGSATRALLGNVVAAGPETSFHFLSPIQPRKVIIDPQMTLLCVPE
jgi:hypothetical protein